MIQGTGCTTATTNTLTCCGLTGLELAPGTGWVVVRDHSAGQITWQRALVVQWKNTCFVIR